jgi:hypothetical protein
MAFRVVYYGSWFAAVGSSVFAFSREHRRSVSVRLIVAEFALFVFVAACSIFIVRLEYQQAHMQAATSCGICAYGP